MIYLVGPTYVELQPSHAASPSMDGRQKDIVGGQRWRKKVCFIVHQTDLKNNSHIHI